MVGSMITGWVAMGIAAAATAQVDAETRAAILDCAREPVAASLGKPVLFRVKRLGASGDWAFLHADMEERGGKPIDFAGTPRADDAAHGAVSRTYAALLRRNGTEWRVVAHAIGPTDVAWADWATRYGAPPAIFN